MKKMITFLLAAAIVGGNAVSAFAYNSRDEEDIIPNNLIAGQLAYSDGKWYYDHDDNWFKLTGFQKIEGKTYCFDKDGRMLKGWQEIDGKTYYFRDNGRLVSGRTSIEDTIYQFSAYGVLEGEVGPSTSTGVRTGYIDEDPLDKIVREYESARISSLPVNNRDLTYLTTEKLEEKLKKAQEDLAAMQAAYDALPENTRKGLLYSMEYQLRQYENSVDLFEAMLDERAEEE